MDQSLDVIEMSRLPFRRDRLNKGEHEADGPHGNTDLRGSDVRRVLVDGAVVIVQDRPAGRTELVMSHVKLRMPMHGDVKHPVLQAFMNVLWRRDWQTANRGSEHQAQDPARGHAMNAM